MGLFNDNKKWKIQGIDTNSKLNNKSNRQNFNGNAKLDVNKKNSEEFQNLMDNASTNLDSYWDKNNPLIQIFLFLLFIIIVLGAIYYITAWNATK